MSEFQKEFIKDYEEMSKEGFNQQTKVEGDFIHCDLSSLDHYVNSFLKD
ncbi:hypothetical protein [Salipaludibacillus sp. CF4.18]